GPPRLLHPFPPRRSSDLGVSSSAPFFWSPDRGFDDPIGDPRTNAGMNDMDERLRLVGALHGGFPPRGVLWTRRAGLVLAEDALPDRKSTRLNSSHVKISY